MKTKGSQYKLPFGGTLVNIPRGLKVIPADNQPQDSEIKFWLAELSPRMEFDEQIESHYRNYGFGLTAEEVE